MSLIDQTTLLKVADRAASQYKYLIDAFTSLNQTGTIGPILLWLCLLKIQTC